MLNNKGKLRVSFVFSIFVTAFVTASVKNPIGNFNLADFLGNEGDFIINLLSLAAGAVSGLTANFVLSRIIKTEDDEL